MEHKQWSPAEFSEQQRQVLALHGKTFRPSCTTAHINSMKDLNVQTHLRRDLCYCFVFLSTNERPHTAKVSLKLEDQGNFT